jgi:hypothetical protein
VALDPLVGTIARGHPANADARSDFLQRFVVGKTLKGVVLRALPEGKTLVNFGGQQVLLELAQPLSRGQSFLATVVQTLPTLVLNVTHNLPSASSHPTAPQVRPDAENTTPPEVLDATRLKSYLLVKQPFGEMAAALQKHLVPSPLLRTLEPLLLQRLEATLAVLLPQKAAPPDAAGLQQQVEQSGLNYEAKLQQALAPDATPAEFATLTTDLKGQLLALLHRLDQAAGTSPDTPPEEILGLRQHVQQALQNIEFHQLANLFAQQENQSLLLQFLHPALPFSHTARLYFRANSQQKEGHGEAPQQDYTVVFLLHFTALGTVRIDATVQGASVAASIKTEDQTVATFMADQAPSLIERLRHLGFQADIQCCVQEHVPMDLDDALTRWLIQDPSRLLDITA